MCSQVLRHPCSIMLAVFWNISPTASIKWSRKEWLPTLMSPEKIVCSEVFSGLQRCFTFGLRRSRSEGGLASGGWLRVLSHHPVHCALCIVHCIALKCIILHCNAEQCYIAVHWIVFSQPVYCTHCPQRGPCIVLNVLHLLSLWYCTYYPTSYCYHHKHNASHIMSYCAYNASLAYWDGENSE